jgi:hypothetical protein
MKYFKKIILISLIVSFYFIQISYNGNTSNSLGSGLIDFAINGKLLNLYLTYIVINLSFIFWFLKSEKKYSTLFIIIPMLIWYYWKIIYEGIIDINLYLKSSIPYLLFSFSSLFIGIYKPKK